MNEQEIKKEITNCKELVNVLNAQAADLRAGNANLKNARELSKTATNICNLVKLDFEYQKHKKIVAEVSIDFLN